MTNHLENSLNISIAGGLKVAVPPAAVLMTPFILLEQEDWFEDEIKFIRRIARPGMTALDVGANYGTYSLTFAKSAGPTAQIYSVEPTRLPGAFFSKSIELNGFKNIRLLPYALSDFIGEAEISTSNNPELSSLSLEIDAADSRSETVQVTTLNSLCNDIGIGKVDFLKLDVEGEENKVISASKSFFHNQSPLVMFELPAKGSDLKNPGELLTDLSYEIYRLVPGLECLVPVGANEELDSFQVNLFACKADKAKTLSDNNLLVLTEQPVNPESISGAWGKFADKLGLQEEYRTGLKKNIAEKQPSGYDEVLDLYAAAREKQRPMCERFSCLASAYRTLLDQIKVSPSTERTLSLIRIASDLGWRHDAVRQTSGFLKTMESEHFSPKSVFIPLSDRFERTPVKDSFKNWLMASAWDLRARHAAYSAYFSGPNYLNLIDGLRNSPYVYPEIERRWQLVKICSGQQLETEVLESLTTPSPENLNADIWSIPFGPQGA